LQTEADSQRLVRRQETRTVLQPLREDQQERVAASRAFVETLARRVAASMPGGIDVADLVQDGMIGLIDAMHRFDDSRGIRFETFAERRVRGAMIDALRRDAWPRGVRRQRRELEAAREALRSRDNGAEPSVADLAEHLGTNAERLGRTILRIATIEATASTGGTGAAEHDLPAGCVPSMPPAPDEAYAATEPRNPRRPAMAAAGARDRRWRQVAQSLLLPQRDDEGHRRGTARERVPGLAAARTRAHAPRAGTAGARLHGRDGPAGAARRHRGRPLTAQQARPGGRGCRQR